MSFLTPVKALRFADPPRLIASAGAARLPAHLPPHTDGMRIGLFGGTFNPPHAGHLLVSRIAMARMKLDRVWWIVTPGNPLKENAGLPPLESRMAAARKLADHPRIDITGFEAEIGIATGRMHARGPVGLAQLCSFKYRVRGSGQTRP